MQQQQQQQQQQQVTLLLYYKFVYIDLYNNYPLIM